VLKHLCKIAYAIIIHMAVRYALYAITWHKAHAQSW